MILSLAQQQPSSAAFDSLRVSNCVAYLIAGDLCDPPIRCIGACGSPVRSAAERSKPYLLKDVIRSYDAPQPLGDLTSDALVHHLRPLHERRFQCRMVDHRHQNSQPPAGSDCLTCRPRLHPIRACSVLRAQTAKSMSNNIAETCVPPNQLTWDILRPSVTQRANESRNIALLVIFPTPS